MSASFIKSSAEINNSAEMQVNRSIKVNRSRLNADNTGICSIILIYGGCCEFDESGNTGERIIGGRNAQKFEKDISNDAIFHNRIHSIAYK